MCFYIFNSVISIYVFIFILFLKIPLQWSVFLTLPVFVDFSEV